MTRTASFILVGLFFSLHILTGCGNKKEILQSHSTTKSITIDGDLSDWPHEKAMIQSSDYFNYYITHDSHYLYIFTSFKSQFYQNAAANIGFSIYIDNNKKNKRSFGITYPLGVTNAMRELPNIREEYTDDPEWMKEKAHQELWKRLKASVFDKVMLTRKLSAKSDPQHLILPIEQVNAQGIKIARLKEGRKLQLELRIPIVSSRTEQFAADPQDGKPLHIGFEIQPPEIDLSDEVSNSVTNNRRRGSYGRGYGYGYGMGYGRQPNSSELEHQMAQRMGEYSEWFWIQL